MRAVRAGVLAAVCLLASTGQTGSLAAQSGRPAAIQESELRRFLAHLASDQMLGRRAFTEGYGLAAGYVAALLGEWGVQPLGDDGSYFQQVALHDVDIVADNSSVTVEVNGASRTFRNGEGVSFASPPGGAQTVVLEDAEFLGYARYLADGNDYAGRDVAGKAVVWMNALPADVPDELVRVMNSRARHAIERGAAVSISYVADRSSGERAAAAVPAPGGRGRGGRGGRLMVNTALGTTMQGDFLTTEDFTAPKPPQLNAGDEFFEFLFTGAPASFAEVKALASRQEPLPGFALPRVKLTITVDPTYRVLNTLYTHNVVGMVEGADPRLKDTYVMFGAHLDHVGYTAAPRAAGAGVRCPETSAGDVISNGANDDGSGAAALLAIARLLASGQPPRRSTVFVWHSGEEFGLYGSKYNADFPVVPLERVVAHLNLDMIGRDEWDNRERDFSDSVHVIGADRISTQLHNVIVDVNQSQASPMTLDYSLNDPADPEAIYYRSDHYSYAAKGIPAAFFTTGLFVDYHCPSDTADKIQYDKMARIAQFVFETGLALANRETPLERDRLGPRAGRGFEGPLGR
jgi:hypothetical protein